MCLACDAVYWDLIVQAGWCCRILGRGNGLVGWGLRLDGGFWDVNVVRECGGMVWMKIDILVWIGVLHW